MRTESVKEIEAKQRMNRRGSSENPRHITLNVEKERTEKNFKTHKGAGVPHAKRYAFRRQRASDGFRKRGGIAREGREAGEDVREPDTERMSLEKVLTKRTTKRASITST